MFKKLLMISIKMKQNNFPGGSEESSFNAGDRGFDLWVGRIPWRSEWLPTPVLLPGKITWTEELGGLQFMGLQRVGHD